VERQNITLVERQGEEGGERKREGERRGEGEKEGERERERREGRERAERGTAEGMVLAAAHIPRATPQVNPHVHDAE